jgi:hypothetical protein
VVLLFLLFSCEEEASFYEEQMSLGNVILKNEESQRVNDDMIVEVLDIQDSRCPVGVVCATAGVVHIDMEVYIDKEFVYCDFDYSEFNSYCIDTVNDYSIQIIDVTPYPYEEDYPLDPNDYSIIAKVVQL